MNGRFNRPVEYDPTLQSQSVKSKEDQLKNEFGLDDSASEDNSEEESEELSEEEEDQEEIARLQKKLAQVQKDKKLIEKETERLDGMAAEVQLQSKQFKEQSNQTNTAQKSALMENIKEYEEMVNRDNAILERLEESFDPSLLESGNVVAMGRDNDDLQQKGEELANSLMAFRKKAKGLEEERNMLRESAQNLSGGALTIGRKVAAIEHEISKIQEQRSKLQASNTELTNKIGELTQKANPPKLAEGEDPILAARKAAAKDLKVAREKLSEEEKMAEKLTKQHADASEKVDKVKATLDACNTALETHKKEASQERAKMEEVIAKSANTQDDATRALTESLEKLKADKIEAEALLEAKTKEQEDSKLDAKNKLAGASDQIRQLKEDYASKKKELTEAKNETAAVKEKTQALQVQVDGMATAGQRRKKVLKGLSNVCKSSRQALEPMKETVAKFPSVLPDNIPKMIERLEKWKAKLGKTNDTVLENYKKEMALRRKYFNQLQLLKGAIRVFCRVRAPQASLGETEEGRVISIPNEDAILVKGGETPCVYDFEDVVVKPSQTNTEVVKLLEDLIVSSLDGHNVTIFSFGQTGSGKTHTMQGNDDDQGLFYQAIQLLFQTAERRGPESKFEFRVAMFEVDQNDSVSDIGSGARTSLKCSEENGRMTTPDLEWRDVKTPEQASGIVGQGAGFSSSSPTHSSSSTILSFEVTGHNSVIDKDSLGRVNFVDLSGSEDPEKSRGLMGVLHATAHKKTPKFHTSRVAHLLQSSLENQGKVVVLLHLSPCDTNESKSALEWAKTMKKKTEPVAKKKKGTSSPVKKPKGARTKKR